MKNKAKTPKKADGQRKMWTTLALSCVLIAACSSKEDAPDPVECGALTNCHDVCVDTTKDAQNCGSCDQACLTNQVCENSECKNSPKECNDLTNCHDVCLDITKDVKNCGSCDHACLANQVCENSACKDKPASDCDSLRLQILTLIQANQKCSEGTSSREGCNPMDSLLPTNHPDFCDLVSTIFPPSGGGSPESHPVRANATPFETLSALVVEWGNNQCGQSGFSCPVDETHGKMAVCEAGQCKLLSIEYAICDGLMQEVKTWLEMHSSCDLNAAEEVCQLLEFETVAPLQPALCFMSANVGNDRAQIEAIDQRWKDSQCGLFLECGGMSQDSVAKCVDVGLGPRCGFWGSFDECMLCMDKPEKPVCTVNNHNLVNACAAQWCFQEDVAHGGWCEDSQECIDAGGTCNETKYNEYPCPTGSQYVCADSTASMETTKNCPTGQIRNYCCTNDWAYACDFTCVDGWGFIGNPFTNCSADEYAFAVVQETTAQPQSCTIAAKILQRKDFVVEREISATIILGANRQLTMEAADSERSKKVSCTGSQPRPGMDSGSFTWSCRISDLDGSNGQNCNLGVGGAIPMK